MRAPDSLPTRDDQGSLKIHILHIRYDSEGLDRFEAEAGDVVYVPRQTWHPASNGRKEGERSCRLAMNGFPYQAHIVEVLQWHRAHPQDRAHAWRSQLRGAVAAAFAEAPAGRPRHRVGG